MRKGRTRKETVSLINRMNQDQLSFLTGSNALYVCQLYGRYAVDPTSVDQEWAAFFRNLDDDSRIILSELQGPSWGINFSHGSIGEHQSDTVENLSSVNKNELQQKILDSIRSLMMIRVYRVRGHLEATLDPLGIQHREPHPELDYHNYGFTEADFDRPIFLDNVLGLETGTLRQILQILRSTYCGNIGVEFMHIQDPDQKSWIQKRIESIRNHTDFTERGKKAILERLTEAEGLERFLQKKYTGTKRFGLEGAEVLIPALEQIIKRGSQLGLIHVLFGMAHRGRLNVLTNFLKKTICSTLLRISRKSGYAGRCLRIGRCKISFRNFWRT